MLYFSAKKQVFAKTKGQPMKIILSRKGFDSGYGGMPSPILPDRTLLSMPIPSKDAVRYDELRYGGKSYLELLRELKPTFKHETCHLDPDIRDGAKEREKGWTAAFGQEGAALSHLLNQGVGVGDLFLFFGWFRQTEIREGRLRFVEGAPDLHVIYGYLQIGRILSSCDEIGAVPWHPHADPGRRGSKRNAIFLPAERLLDTDLPGYGVFGFDERLVLTKKGETRTHWELPQCLVGKNISYHSEKNLKDGYFQSAARGQEFVVEADDAILGWAKSLL